MKTTDQVFVVKAIKTDEGTGRETIARLALKETMKEAEILFHGWWEQDKTVFPEFQKVWLH